MWIKAATKPDRSKYFKMVIEYVDDIVHALHDTTETINGLKAVYNKVGPLDMYLGATIENKIIDGVTCWTTTSKKYVKAGVDNLNKKLAKKGLRLPSECPTSMTSRYQLELNLTAELNNKDARILPRVGWGFEMSSGAWTN